MDALREFFQMGGHAFYVWWSYAIVAAMLALNIAVPVARARRLRERLRRLADPASGKGPEPSDPA